jgi:hypothetical protein
MNVGAAAGMPDEGARDYQSAANLGRIGAVPGATLAPAPGDSDRRAVTFWRRLRIEPRLTYRAIAKPRDGLAGTGTTGLFGPLGNNSGRFASSYAVTARTAAACFKSPATALSNVSLCE